MSNRTIKITTEQRIVLLEVMREISLFLASKHVDLVVVECSPYNSRLCLSLGFFDNAPSKEFLKELFWLFVYNKINIGKAPLQSASHITECLEIEEEEDNLFMVTLSIAEQGD